MNPAIEKLEENLKFWRVRTMAFPVDKAGELASINPVEVPSAVETVLILESLKACVEALEDVKGVRDRIFDAVLTGQQTVASNMLFQLEIKANNAITLVNRAMGVSHE